MFRVGGEIPTVKLANGVAGRFTVRVAQVRHTARQYEEGRKQRQLI
jgi:hypothetical protein